MIGLIRVKIVVCQIMGKYSDTTLEHEECLEAGIGTVYKEMMFGLGGFPFLLF